MGRYQPVGVTVIDSMGYNIPQYGGGRKEGIVSTTGGSFSRAGWPKDLAGQNLNNTQSIVILCNLLIVHHHRPLQIGMTSPISISR